jgi:hypothetical protein
MVCPIPPCRIDLSFRRRRNGRHRCRAQGLTGVQTPSPQPKSRSASSPAFLFFMNLDMMHGPETMSCRLAFKLCLPDSPMLKRNLFTSLLFSALLAVSLVGSGFAAERHDCDHEGTCQHHDCALCWISFSVAENSPSIDPTFVEPVALAEAALAELSIVASPVVVRCSRAPPSA